VIALLPCSATQGVVFGQLCSGVASGSNTMLVVLTFAGYWNGLLVAVKVLEQVAGDFNPRSSLEPLLHHRLSHPNIVAMFDVCTQVRAGGHHCRAVPVLFVLQLALLCIALRVWSLLSLGDGSWR